MKKKIILGLCCAVLTGSGAVLAHAPGKVEDDHEARKQMEEKRDAEQSWDSFMQKVKSQDSSKGDAAQHKADADDHSGHHEY